MRAASKTLMPSSTFTVRSSMVSDTVGLVRHGTQHLEWSRGGSGQTPAGQRVLEDVASISSRKYSSPVRIG